MIAGLSSVGLAVFYLLAVGWQVPLPLGAPVRSSSNVEGVSCLALSGGFTGRAAFHYKSRYSVGDPTYECNGDGTTTVNGTLMGVHVHKDRLVEWSVNVTIVDASGVIVAKNFDSGGRENGNLIVTVTATFGPMNVTGTLEWFPTEAR